MEQAVVEASTIPGNGEGEGIALLAPPRPEAVTENAAGR
jgi:hypothetical protein